MHANNNHHEAAFGTRGGANALSVLERVAQVVGVSFDRLAAKRSLAEAEQTYPGEGPDVWPKRLLEVGQSLGIRFKQIECSMREAQSLLRQGAPVITEVFGDDGSIEWYILTEASGDRVRHDGGGQSAAWVKVDALAETLGVASPDESVRWLIAQPTLVCSEAARQPDDAPLEPFARLLRLLRPEQSDLAIVVVFAIFVGILALATPIAVEALVNTVAFGRLLQPVIVLSILLLTFLSFAAALIAVQTYIVELLQRRLFIRVVADLAFRLPRTRREALDGRFGPELVNRFFDVVTLQKAAATLSLDAVAIVLQTVIGMAVLAFYHPFLLGFDIFLLLLIAVVIFVFGRNAVTTAIKESKSKYAIGAWLEELVRHPSAFRYFGGDEFALDKADRLAGDYLGARKHHFRIVMRQIVLALALQVVASTVLLGLGGWLVITGQLTLGQLVAAELIVTAIVTSFAKLGKHLETFYDLLAAIEKLGQLFDLPVESHDEYFHPHKEGPAAVNVQNVSYRYPSGVTGVAQADFEVEPGQRVAITGPSGSGKSTLVDLLFHFRVPTTGRVEFDGVDLKDLRSDSVRERIALARGVEIFEGTVAENVHLHRVGVSIERVRGTLASVELLEEVMGLPDGLDQQLTSDGAPLTQSQRRRLMLARAIADDPRLLLIDGTLDALADDEVDVLASRLCDPSRPWTLLVATGRDQIKQQCGRVIKLPQSDFPGDSGSNDGMLLGSRR